MIYEIIYDYSNEYADESNLSEDFEGTHTELLDYIKQMRENGCYNISATALDQEGE